MSRYAHNGRFSTGESLSSAVDDAALDIVLRVFLSPLIDALPVDERDAVWRAEILGESPETIGHALGLDGQIIEERLRRGRRTLARLTIMALKPSVLM